LSFTEIVFTYGHFETIEYVITLTNQLLIKLP